MGHDLMKKMTVLCSILCVIAMGIIFYLSSNKVITISDVAQDEVSDVIADEVSIKKEEQILTFVLGESDTSYLRIPLHDNCKAEDIMIENHYMDQELCVVIKGAKEAFYTDNAISGNRKMIREGKYEVLEDGIKLIFRLTGIFEYRTILENNDLYVSFLNPKEEFDRIVVIDPACGGTNDGFAADNLKEKDITLQIARKLKEKLDKTDIKVYYTRMDDVNPAEKERVFLANEIRADMYIRIQVDADEDVGVYGTTTVYNGDYFIPGFGSIELADVLEREVVTSIKGKALGLCEAQPEEYAIRNITIPAAAVKVGCITNKQEASLLERDEYQGKIADGIYNAIMKIYEGAE